MRKSGSVAYSGLKTIPIKEIMLDVDNPRYYEAQVELDLEKWTDKKLEEYILSEDTSDILPSIKLHGIKDPIWVHEISQGKYVMVEGSRRLVVLRQLINGNFRPSKSVSYDKVSAHVYPKNTDQKIINAQKVILQTGKKKWGAFNEAKAIYDLIHKDRYSPDEVAKIWRKSRGSIEKELQNYKYYHEFTNFVKANKLATINPRHYSYFQKASMDVRLRFFGTKKQREQFYKLMIPDKNGITKIPNVSLKGGLIKAFNKFVKNEIILKILDDNPTTKVINTKHMEIYKSKQYTIIKANPSKNNFRKYSIVGKIATANWSGHIYDRCVKDLGSNKLVKVYGLDHKGLGYRWFLTPDRKKLSGKYFQHAKSAGRLRLFTNYFDFTDIVTNVYKEGGPGCDYKDSKKPEQLINEILEMTTSKNDLVLDFFGGSGTTLACCIKKNRSCIVIEKSKPALNAISQRMKNLARGKDQDLKKYQFKVFYHHLNHNVN